MKIVDQITELHERIFAHICHLILGERLVDKLDKDETKHLVLFTSGKRPRVESKADSTIHFVFWKHVSDLLSHALIIALKKLKNSGWE